MSSPMYEAVIVNNPVAVTAFPNQVAVPGSDHWFELTKKQLEVVLPNCVGKPIRIEHSAGNVGKVHAAFIDADAKASVQFRFDGSEVGRNAHELMKSGVMKGVSLCHDPKTLDVQEVSICFGGARPGTGVKGMVAAARSNQDSCKAPAPPVYVSSKVCTSNWIVASSIMSEPAVAATPDVVSGATEPVADASPQSKLSSSDEAILQLATRGTPPTADEMTGILDRLANDRSANTALKAQLADAMKMLKESGAVVSDIQSQFMNVLLPFMKEQLGSSMTPTMENAVVTASKDKNAKPFMEAWMPMVVMASANSNAAKANAAREAIIADEVSRRMKEAELSRNVDAKQAERDHAAIQEQRIYAQRVANYTRTMQASYSSQDPVSYQPHVPAPVSVDASRTSAPTEWAHEKPAALPVQASKRCKTDNPDEPHLSDHIRSLMAKVVGSNVIAPKIPRTR
jgi:hypothetical protein